MSDAELDGRMRKIDEMSRLLAAHIEHLPADERDFVRAHVLALLAPPQKALTKSATAG
jgi:hypothetical protein